MAAKREPWTRERFVAALEQDGVAPDCAAFLWSHIQPYYFAPLTPRPDDTLIGLVRVDPEDIPDLFDDFAKERGVVPPPGALLASTDPTWLELAHWLDDNVRAANG